MAESAKFEKNMKKIEGQIKEQMLQVVVKV